MSLKTVGQLSAATAISATSDLMIIEQSGYARQEDVFTIVSAGFPPGVITAYGGATAPTGWLICNGAAVSRTTYAKLFTAISTAWGVGDGSTTFNLPDLRESAPVGIGTTSSLITSTGSAVTAHDTYTLGQFKDDQLQGHYHATNGQLFSSTNGSFGMPGGSDDSAQSAAVQAPSTDGTNGTPRTSTVTRGKRSGVNYIIKY